MPSRWEHLLETKPIPLIDHLLEEVSKLLARDLQKWPLPVQELDLDTGGKFAELLRPDAKRPEPAAFEEAFKVTRWELEREIEASADYFRNCRWREHGLTDQTRIEILFISRWLVEELLSLREYTHSRITRPQLVDLLERTMRRYRLAAQSP
ncbi:MAG: hypothetical protein IRZ16_15885 [Myxococcaceae bacterium]|nr:hypothetical protein [Myxococcaceae bacterium]